MRSRIIIFNSTHQELKAEEHLRENSIEFAVVPLPEEISAGCGIAIEVETALLSAVKDIIERRHITVKAIVEN